MLKKVDLDALVQATKINIEDNPQICESIANVLDWAEAVQNIDTEGVAPLFNTLDNLHQNNLREDVPCEGESFENLAQNTKNKQDGFFLVPRVIG